MSSNVREFGLRVGAIGADLPRERVETIHRAAHLEAGRSFVLWSPVDSGRFRGNWASGRDAPPLGYDWEKKDRTGGATVGAIAAFAAGIPAFGVSWLVNNLPYAVRLSQGSSKQAPAGTFDATVARLRSWLARQR